MRYSQFLAYFRDALKAFSKINFTFATDSVEYALGQAVAALSSKINALIDSTEGRISLLTAQNTDLDELASNFRLSRKTSSFSEGYLKIWRNTLPSSPEIIPAGHIVETVDGNKFILTETSVIPSNTAHYPTDIFGTMGARFYAVPLGANFTTFETEDLSEIEIRQQLLSTTELTAQSQQTGLSSNAASNTIQVSKISTINVNNPEPFSGGADVETDEVFRDRIISSIRGANSKFTKNALEAFLKSYPGVIDAVIVEDCSCLTFEPPQSGSIYAIINTSLVPNNEEVSVGKYTSIPRNIYEKIRNLLEDEGYRPLGHGIVVKEADVVNIGFKSTSGNYLNIYLDSDANPAQKKVAIQTLLYDYFTGLLIGQDIYKTDIIKILKEDPEILDIDSFSFLKLLGRNDLDVEEYSELTELIASGNQVFRISQPEAINVRVQFK